MHLKTILNRLYPVKRFVYDHIALVPDHELSSIGDEKLRLVVNVRPRSNSAATCSGCGFPAPCYDRLPPREFQFVPVWGMRVFLRYSMRRVKCPGCDAVLVERIPWVDGKQRSCNVFRAFLASWAEDLPWKRVAERFRTSWQTVFRAVEWVVDYGLERRDLEGVTAIGVDEIKYQSGQKYLTVVYQLDAHCRRLLWVGKKRTADTLFKFFREMEGRLPGFCISIMFICSDMWKPYLATIKKCIGQAVHVLDRFHIRNKFSDAIDDVRRQEVKRLKEEGKEPVLSNSRWCVLKKRKNLTGKQRSLLKELLQMNLKTTKAYLLTQQFEHFWTYSSVTWAKKFLKNWTFQAMRSKIEPVKSVARMLRRHEELILNWFRAKKEINNGITEGLNLNIKLAIRKARGFRSFDIARTAFYHQLGRLPKPSFDHEFW